ncbi:hypothetical protein GCM10010279_28230 [Streptomyces mutabilis]|nr:hypothetical protein GCM10010279_28230 [Streptomyces mutabilis]
MPFEQRARLAERLRTGRLAQRAELIGRFRQMADGERARRVENATGELIGVTLGDDLSLVIPSELAALGVPELRAVFAARYAAGELMLYDSQGEQATGRGAVIACVDTRTPCTRRGPAASPGTRGPNPAPWRCWTRPATRGATSWASCSRRPTSSGASASRRTGPPASPGCSTSRSPSWGGGTSYQRPLTAAAELLEEEFNDLARARGDIVMLTGDDCGVTEEWMRSWNGAKHRLGFRVFGIAVGAPRVTGEDSVLDALCDNLRAVEDLTDVHASVDLFRAIWP